jgi:hypothetical protein
MILWHEPICSQLLAKLINWYNIYEQGSVYATRDYMNLQGKIEKKPTIYLNKVAFKVIEFKYLSEIMFEVAPKKVLTKDILKIYNNMLNRFSSIPAGKNKPILTVKNEWLISVAFYKEDLSDIIKLLLKVKNGKVVDQKEVMEDLFMQDAKENNVQ